MFFGKTYVNLNQNTNKVQDHNLKKHYNLNYKFLKSQPSVKLSTGNTTTSGDTFQWLHTVNTAVT